MGYGRNYCLRFNGEMDYIGFRVIRFESRPPGEHNESR